jgi:hypothetical protein
VVELLLNTKTVLFPLSGSINVTLM